MSYPNLFKYATKELSQDAFICWLLAWADKQHQDNEMHFIGKRFLEALTNKFPEKNIPAIESINIYRQKFKIDILCLINTTFNEVLTTKNPPVNSLAIIIEDKVGAGIHGKQLEQYRKKIESLGFNDSNILGVYLKTKDQKDYDGAKAQNYKPFIRRDILEVLSNGGNQILIDFREYWGNVESESLAYENTSHDQWDKSTSWRGFYKALDAAGNLQGKWTIKSYSDPKPTYGGIFMMQKQECSLYIQLCQSRLNFKIRVNDKNNFKRLRAKWTKFLKNMPLSDGIKILEPKRSGFGKSMVVGYIESYIQTENKIPDIQNTVQYLNRINLLMNEWEVV